MGFVTFSGDTNFGEAARKLALSQNSCAAIMASQAERGLSRAGVRARGPATPAGGRSTRGASPDDVVDRRLVHPGVGQRGRAGRRAAPPGRLGGLGRAKGVPKVLTLALSVSRERSVRQ